MPALQVKDCPQDVYDALRMCAMHENRSISQQALTILEGYLGIRSGNPRRRSRQDITWSARAPHWEPAEKDIDYVEKRKRLFEEINSRPPILESETVPGTVELLRQVREEEAL